MAVESVNSKTKECVEVFTLGHFLVKHGETLISEKTGRSNKLWELFKYFLTNRNNLISPETVIETLWPEQEYVQPKSALHNLVYRLRRLFEQESSSGPFSIEFSQGCYCFTLNHGCYLDAEELVSLSQRAAGLVHNNPTEAVKTYRQALSLYMGEYLPEHSRESWLMPARRTYRGIYLKNILELVELLKAEHKYSEIQKVCESAFLIDPFVEKEEPHFLYMEALVEQGKKGDALIHYEFITSLLYQETGAEPTASMRDFYRMVRAERENVEPKLSDIISNRLKERPEAKGAFLCNRDFFRHLYVLEMRRSKRSERSFTLGLMTITGPGHESPDQETLSKATALLKKVLSSNLRSGDAFCQWNEAQFLILLSEFDYRNTEKLLKRIEKKFASRLTKEGVILRGQVQKLFPWS